MGFDVALAVFRLRPRRSCLLSAETTQLSRDSRGLPSVRDTCVCGRCADDRAQRTDEVHSVRFRLRRSSRWNLACYLISILDLLVIAQKHDAYSWLITVRTSDKPQQQDCFQAVKEFSLSVLLSSDCVCEENCLARFRRSIIATWDTLRGFAVVICELVEHGRNLVGTWG